MPLRPIEGRRAVLERIAADLKRLEKEAADCGEDFLAFLLANASREATTRSEDVEQTAFPAEALFDAD